MSKYLSDNITYDNSGKYSSEIPLILSPSWPKPDTILSNQDTHLTRTCSRPQKVDVGFQC